MGRALVVPSASPDGTRSWLFRSMQHGKAHRHGLGAVRNVGLHAARQRAEELRVAVRNGCKTVCPPLLVRWLVLHCASEGCLDWPSRSSSQEDEPWQIIGKHLSESMSQSLGTPWRLRIPAGRE
ncbi:Arm DNA-binding domain-containing protein [Mesorhizobium sp. J428]|uniref:Arm DNA-binding domain-containing protein n=1 Tax=Mesorhizobium sp. J428 TaxID=2898440 RepID=UPI0035AE4496